MRSKLSPSEKIQQDMGFHFGMGLIRALVQTALWLAFFVWVLRVIGLAVFPTDDTDFSRWDRSGVELVTDAKTGRQYLKTPQGFIVPREERK